MSQISWRPKTTLYVSLILVLLFTIACGTAAQDSTSGDAAAPAVPQAGGAPAAAPAAADPVAVAGTQISPGRVTLMLGGFNAEVFDNTIGGLSKEPRKHIHGSLSSWDLIDGEMQIVPGIARKWEYSQDLKTLTYTIMEGGKFHDGRRALQCPRVTRVRIRAARHVDR